jgi:hypothetical protein
MHSVGCGGIGRNKAPRPGIGENRPGNVGVVGEPPEAAIGWCNNGSPDASWFSLAALLNPHTLTTADGSRVAATVAKANNNTTTILGDTIFLFIGTGGLYERGRWYDTLDD